MLCWCWSLPPHTLFVSPFFKRESSVFVETGHTTLHFGESLAACDGKAAAGWHLKEQGVLFLAAAWRRRTNRRLRLPPHGRGRQWGPGAGWDAIALASWPSRRFCWKRPLFKSNFGKKKPQAIVLALLSINPSLSEPLYAISLIFCVARFCYAKLAKRTKAETTS